MSDSKTSSPSLASVMVCPELVAMNDRISSLTSSTPPIPSTPALKTNTTHAPDADITAKSSSTLQKKIILFSRNSSHHKEPLLHRSSPIQRTPLRILDQNASIMFRAAQKGTSLTPKNSHDATRSSPSSMPLDRPKVARAATSNLNQTPPLKPKAPLTPRVAASNTSATPSARRPPRDTKQDTTTPLSGLLGNNITPRSGNRKSRIIDSPNVTPTTTTTTPVLASHNTKRKTEDTNHQSTSPLRAVSPTRSDLGHHTPNVDTDRDSKFFFANEAKSVIQPGRQNNRPILTTKSSGSSFIYANGITLPPTPRPDGSMVGGHAAFSSIVGDENSQSKFFHANGTPDAASASHTRSTGSVISTSRPRLAQHPSVVLPPPRSTSPGKKDVAASVGDKVLASSPVLLQSSRSSTSDPKHLRRASSDIPPRLISHANNSSINSDTGAKSMSSKRSSVGSDIGAKPYLVKRFSNGPMLAANYPSSPTQYTMPSPTCAPTGLASPNAFFPGIVSPGLSSINSFVDEMADSTLGDNKLDIDSAPSTLSTHSEEPEMNPGIDSLAKLNELAAQARKERKVLDLEIRNTSLESINKTLEKQMRKQTAELRRYRRLSRSGRLSVLPISSTRSSTERLSRIGEDGEDNGVDETLDLSDDDFDFGDELDAESNTSDDLDEGVLSPEAIAAHDAKHRERDEKRLQLDLTKHQQLLIDSQKMNQSLKKCLSWTEELIADGKKALAYNVKVSDVQLGGRVLLPDIDDCEEEENVDESFDQPDHEEDSMHERLSEIPTLAWSTLGGFKYDRDSGVDIAPPCLQEL